MEIQVFKNDRFGEVRTMVITMNLGSWVRMWQVCLGI